MAISAPMVVNSASKFAKTLAQLRKGSLRVTPINISDTGTYSVASGVGEENAEVIEDYWGAMIADKQCGLVVESPVAIADHNGDGIGLLYPSINGGFVECLGNGGGRDFHGDVWAENINAGFYRVGANEAATPTLFQYIGAHADLRLRLIGNVWNTSDGYTAALSNRATDLLSVVNLDASGARGAKVTITLHGDMGINGLRMPVVSGGSFADTIFCPKLYFGNISGYMYRVDELQSIKHTIGELMHRGEINTGVFYFNGGCDADIGTVYASNGTLLTLGPSLANNSASISIRNFKFDNNIPTTDFLICDCQSRDGIARVRIAGNVGTSLPPQKQLVRRLESAGLGSPDIRLDVKGITAVEASAYPQRPVKGEGWNSTTTNYPIRIYDSTILAVTPSDLSTLTPSNLKHGDSLATVTDASASANVFVPQTTAPLFNRYGSNWLSAINFRGDGVTNYRLVDESPHASMSGLSDFTLMAVVYPSRIDVSSQIINIHNTSSLGGMGLSITNSGLMQLYVKGTTIQSAAAVTRYRPILVIAQWTASTGAMKLITDNATPVTGASSTGAMSLNGSLVLGGYQDTTYQGRCDADLSCLFIDDVAWDISDSDPANWPEDAYDRLNCLRAGWGVW